MSPIKGLSETRRLPRLGKIHLGVKARNAKGMEYPTAVDYFVCPPPVQAVFGAKPKELRILIPVEDEEKWCSQYYRCYSRTRGLVCKGDGEKCMRLVDVQTGDLAWQSDTTATKMAEMTCQGRECPDYGAKCKEVMNLQFLLPEVPGLGIWQVDTGSINSIRNINSAAELIRKLYGRIALLPLLLTIESQEVTIPDTHKKKTVYVLNLRVKDTLAAMLQIASKPLDKALMPGDVDEELELPVSDDDIPELIIPAAQAPRGQEPPSQVVEGSTNPASPSPSTGGASTTPAARPVPAGGQPGKPAQAVLAKAEPASAPPDAEWDGLPSAAHPAASPGMFAQWPKDAPLAAQHVARTILTPARLEGSGFLDFASDRTGRILTRNADFASFEEMERLAREYVAAQQEGA